MYRIRPKNPHSLIKYYFPASPGDPVDGKIVDLNIPGNHGGRRRKMRSSEGKVEYRLRAPETPKRHTWSEQNRYNTRSAKKQRGTVGSRDLAGIGRPIPFNLT